MKEGRGIDVSDDYLYDLDDEVDDHEKKQKHLVGGKWVLTRSGGRGSDGFCSLRGISYSPRATDWHTCTT